MGDRYCIGMCAAPPGALATAPVLRVTAGGVRHTVLLETLDKGLCGLAQAWVLPGCARRVTLEVEVLTAPPGEVCLSLESGGQPVVDLRCGLPCTLTWGDCIIDVRGA